MRERAWQLITGPTSEPITLDALKLHLRITGSAEDTLLQELLAACRREVEEVTGRALVTQTWELALDGWPRAFCELPRGPLQSITSVTYYGADQTLHTLAADQYHAVTQTTPGWFEWAPGVSAPTLSVDRVLRVFVRYVAGYAVGEVPAPLVQAILLLCGHLYEHREAVVTGTIAVALPWAVEALIGPYRLGEVRPC